LGVQHLAGLLLEVQLWGYPVGLRSTVISSHLRRARARGFFLVIDAHHLAAGAARGGILVGLHRHVAAGAVAGRVLRPGVHHNGIHHTVKAESMRPARTCRMRTGIRSRCRWRRERRCGRCCLRRIEARFVDRYEPSESAPRGVCPVIRRSAPRRLVVAATRRAPLPMRRERGARPRRETTEWQDGAWPERDLFFLRCAPAQQLIPAGFRARDIVLRPPAPSDRAQGGTCRAAGDGRK
jgi:hypothetical protein